MNAIKKTALDIDHENYFLMVVVFTLIMFIGLLLRMVVHLQGPLGFDEICTWVFAKRDSFTSMWIAASSDPTPPLYYACVHFVIRLLGDGPAAMRLPSVLFGVLTLPVTFWLVRIGGFKTAEQLSAMLIVAVSSMLVYYSQELRAYSMLAFAGVAATALLCRSLKTPSFKYCCLYAVSLLLLAYAHRYGYFLICAHILCTVLYKNKKVFFVSTSTFALILLLLFLEIVQGRFSYSEAIDRVSSIGSVLALINMLNVGALNLPSITGSQPAPYSAYNDLSLNLLISVAGLLTFGIIFICGFLKRSFFTLDQRRFLMVLFVCICVPAALALIGGSPLSPKPQWLLRGLIYLWPLYYVLAVVMCSTLRFRPVYVAAIIVLNIGTLYPYYTGFARDDAAVIQQLNELADENDLIIVYPWYLYPAVHYYYRGTAATASFLDPCEWIDLDALDRSDRPLHPREMPPGSSPEVSGDMYIFWRMQDIQDKTCLRRFRDKKIFAPPLHEDTWVELDAALIFGNSAQ